MRPIPRTALVLFAGMIPFLALGDQDGYAVFSAAGEGRPYLGIRSEEETDRAEGGARLVEVVPDSPAARAGLEEGDVIVRFGEHTVRGPASLSRRINERDPGDEVRITVRRGDETLALDVELGKRSSSFYFQVDPGVEPGFAEPRIEADVGRLLGEGFSFSTPRLGELFSRHRLGVQLVETTPELREHLGGSESAGVLVSKVLVGTPAAAAGIRVGDLLVSVDGRDVADVAGLREALAEAGVSCSIELVREGKRRTLDVRFPDPDDEPPTGPRA